MFNPFPSFGHTLTRFLSASVPWLLPPANTPAGIPTANSPTKSNVTKCFVFIFASSFFLEFVCPATISGDLFAPGILVPGIPPGTIIGLILPVVPGHHMPGGGPHHVPYGGTHHG